MKLTKEDIQKFATEDEKKQLFERRRGYVPLYVKHKKIINQFIKDNFDRIRKGEYYPIDVKYPELMDILNDIHCHENLPTDVERYIEGQLSKMTRVGLGNPYLDMADRMGEDIDKYATPEEKEFLEEASDLEEKFMGEYKRQKARLLKLVHSLPITPEKEDEIEHIRWELAKLKGWLQGHGLLESKQLNEKWTAKLSEVYSSFDEFIAYDEIYNLAQRLGFDSAEDAWLSNPKITGSTDPKDYKTVDRGNIRKESKKVREKFQGSANIETLAEAGYNPPLIQTYNPKTGTMSFFNKENEEWELFVERDTPPASWCLEYKNKYWEFVRNMDDDEVEHMQHQALTFYDNKNTDKTKKLTEKYASLYNRQVKAIDEWIKENYHDIKRGGAFFNLDDWPELYDRVINAVNPPRETETLWSDINRYVSDKLSEIPWKNRYPWGDSIDHYITDEEKEALTEAKDYEKILRRGMERKAKEFDLEKIYSGSKDDAEFFTKARDAKYAPKAVKKFITAELKESIADQRSEEFIQASGNDLGVWEEMVKRMTPEERKEAAFEFKSAIRGMVYYRANWRPKRVSLGDKSDKYWDEIKTRRLLYARYLNRIKKHLKESKQLTEIVNPKGKTRKVDNPYEIYKGDDYGYPDWEWRVLKHWIAPEKEDGDPFARVFCAVKSPMTYGSWEYGDVYCTEIPGYKYEGEPESNEPIIAGKKDPLGFGKAINSDRIKNMSDEEIDMISKMFKDE